MKCVCINHIALCIHCFSMTFELIPVSFFSPSRGFIRKVYTVAFNDYLFTEASEKLYAG